MRFLIYGAGWRGGLAFSEASALAALGHEAVVFDWPRYLYSSRFPGKLGIALDRLLFAQAAKTINSALLKTLKDRAFDVFLVHHGAQIQPETIAESRKRCRSVVNWNWDEFFNPIHGSPYIADAFRQYSWILTPRQHLVAEYYARGAQRVERLDFCYDPGIHYPVAVPADDRAQWAADVVFVGSWSRRREEMIAGLEGLKVKVWGSSWHHARSAFRRAANIETLGRRAECEDMSRALNASSISLNILTIENRDLTNVRNLEIPACGAFQLCERTDALLEFFEEGKEVECYASPEELIDKCRYYCSHPGKRDAIALAGHHRVSTSGHTHSHRMATLVSLLKGG